MLRPNTYYFDVSMKNLDPLWDRVFYDFREQSVGKKELGEIHALEAYVDQIPTGKITVAHAKRVLELLSKKSCKKSYFASFLRTCDVSADELLEATYFSVKERLDTLRLILGEYKKHRRKGIRTDVFAIQAYNDGQTAKRRSSAGENKVIAISGLPIAVDISDLDGKIAKVNKNKGAFAFVKIKKEFGIKVSLNKEDKVPDCIFKNKKDVYIVEAKHVRRTGGAQNSSLSELIALINLKTSLNLHFISFLDGSYPKYLAAVSPNQNGTKLEKQKYQILAALKANPSNYFMSTAGLREFFKDLGI